MHLLNWLLRQALVMPAFTALGVLHFLTQQMVPLEIFALEAMSVHREVLPHFPVLQVGPKHIICH